jgi:DNA-binding MarR family transcriptional regulator
MSDQLTYPEVARIVRRGIVRLSRRMRSARTGQPLSASKLTTLGWLVRNGPLTPTELSALEHIRPQSLTRTLAALEDDGFVRRQSGADDRRQSFIAITETGYEALNDDMRQRDAWLTAAMVKTLSPTECELLRLAAQLMERLAETEIAPDSVLQEETWP